MVGLLSHFVNTVARQEEVLQAIDMIRSNQDRIEVFCEQYGITEDMIEVLHDESNDYDEEVIFYYADSD